MSRAFLESEYQTRRKRIDPLLKSQGWNIIALDHTNVIASYPHHAVTEYPTTNGPADYALFVNDELLGIVEAKKVTLGPQNVLSQVERYARGVDSSFDFGGLHVPLLYSTNGEVIWFHDVRHPSPVRGASPAFTRPPRFRRCSAKISKNYRESTRALSESPLNN